MTDRERDLSVERWLRQPPVAGARSESVACLDADTLAAWAEGLLDGPERSSAEAHASGCARCQAMLAVMVRTMPGPPPRSASPIRKWLMMLSPALAAGAAVALWFAVDQKPTPSPVDSRSQEQAMTGRAPESARSSGASAPVVAEKDADRKAPPASLDRKAPKMDAASDVQADARHKEREERTAADKSTTGTLAKARPLNERKDEAPPPAAAPKTAVPESIQASAGNRDANVAPPAAPQQQAGQTQNQGPARQQVAEPLAERVIVAEQPVPAAIAGSTAASRDAVGRGGATAGFADAAFGYRRDAGNFDVVAPDSSARWRVVEGRTVQRSLDAGATWANQYSAADGVTLTAGAAPSSTVCWLVGRGGAIVLTTDGKVWQRVKFQEPVDLTAVISTDARTATVTTANGRRFVTTDSGRSWTPR
jgi:hypothetical protein